MLQYLMSLSAELLVQSQRMLKVTKTNERAASRQNTTFKMHFFRFEVQQVASGIPLDFLLTSQFEASGRYPRTVSITMKWAETEQRLRARDRQTVVFGRRVQCEHGEEVHCAHE